MALIKKTKILICFFFFLILFIVPTKVSAQDPTISDPFCEIVINDNYSISYKYIVDIKNESTSQLIEGYQFSWPFAAPQNLKAMLNSNIVSASASASGDSTLLSISFDNHVLKPGESGTLEISFIEPNSTKQFFQSKLIYLPAINLTNIAEKTKYNLSISPNLPLPTFINIYTSTDDRTFVFETSSGIILIWGEDYTFDVESSFKVSNSTEGDANYFFSLIPKLNTQEVLYKSIKGAELGLKDNNENTFGLLKMLPNGEYEIGYEARIKKNNQLDEKFFPLADFEVDESSLFYVQSTTELLKANSEIDKIKILKDFIISNLTITTSGGFDPENLSAVWKKLDTSYKNRSINSLEASYIFASICHSIGLETSVEYGYSLLPEVLNLNLDTPLVWNRVKLSSGEFILVDFLSESKIKVEFLTNSPLVDRIKFGSWNAGQSYNNILGTLNNLGAHPRFKIVSLGNFVVEKEDQYVLVESNIPSIVYSGEFYSGNLILTNNSNYILPIANITINKENKNSNLEFDSFTNLLLPKQKNIINLQHLREVNFLQNEKKSFNLKIDFESDQVEDVENTLEIRFKPDTKLLLLAFIIINLLISLLVYSIWKLRKKGHSY
jgi:hypothetical protein